jgi:nucleotide sugar dehydrogenase
MATPRVIGGLTPTCARRAAELYTVLRAEVNLVHSIEIAEAAKMLENAYRLVNISFINEFAEYCDSRQIDIRATITAAESKPFGFASFYPSAGAGGHCIPVDPVYLLHDAARAGHQMTTLRAAVAANAAVPLKTAMACKRLVEREGIESGRARILLLGLAYKPDVSDVRNAPCIPLVRALRRHFSDISVHDPRVSLIQVDQHRYVSVKDLPKAVCSADLVVLAQRHSEYPSSLLALARRVYCCDHAEGSVLVDPDWSS